LIDRGAAPVREGRILVGQKAALADGGGNRWLKGVVLKTTSRVLTDEKNVIGYYSFGSNDPAITVRTFGFGFVPGAIAGMFVSTDGRTFKEPQSLAGDLIREGVIGVAGHVAEPYLDATIRPNILFPAYLSGFALAESFYLAMPYVSWQTVVVGDPLCAPFPRKTLQPSDIDKGIDSATAKGIKPDAARLLLRAEARTGKGDKAGAMKALEEATALDAKLPAAHLLLAQSYEES
jgi:hypothetical protein